MALKALIFFACLAAAAASIVAPHLLVLGDDGSYWKGKYDLRELHPALPSVRGGLLTYPYAHGHGYWL